MVGDGVGRERNYILKWGPFQSILVDRYINRADM